MAHSYVFFISLMITFYQLFFFQIRYLQAVYPQDCLKKFKSNNLLGLIVFINLLIWKVLMNNSEIYKRLYKDYTKKFINVNY